MNTSSKEGDAPPNAGRRSVQALEGTTNSFIVTIRSLPGKVGSRQEWRGAVEHAQSRERIYFVHLSRLNEFIVAHSDIVLRSPSRFRVWWQRWKSRLPGIKHR
jgi:hypothetical protein